MQAKALIQQSVSQLGEIGDTMLIAMSLVDLGVATRASGVYDESKAYFLEALQTAAESKTWVVVLNALTEIATTELEVGAWEWALEIVMLCQQHSSTNREGSDQPKFESQRRFGRWGQHRYTRLKRLRAELEAQLTPLQVAEIEERASVRTLNSLVRELLVQRTEV